MASEKDLDTTPFLHDVQNEDLEGTTPKPARRRLWSAVLIHAAIAITYTIAITAFVLSFGKPQPAEDTKERAQRVNGGHYSTIIDISILDLQLTDCSACTRSREFQNMAAGPRKLQRKPFRWRPTPRA